MLVSSVDQLLGILIMANKSRRNTRQRQVVLEELQRLTSHPTASELYGIARQRLPKISLGTVYRNLDILADEGLICRLQTGGAEARFDGNVARHYHVRCVRCGRVDDAHGLPEDPLKSEVKTLRGYEILGFRLEFVGVCPECGNRSAPPDEESAPRAGEQAEQQTRRREPGGSPASGTDGFCNTER